MNGNKTLQKNAENKLSSVRYKIAAVLLPFVIITAFIVIIFLITENYPTDSDAVIHLAVASILQKDPNKLENKDFKNITNLDLSGKTLYNIRLLRKFTNLHELNLSGLNLPKMKTPAWKLLLEKLHILKKPAPQVLFRRVPVVKTSLLSLRPLKKLHNLEVINLNFTPVEDLSPLSHLENLTEIDLFGTPVSELKPIRKLKNLQILNIGQTKVTNLKPLKALIKLERIHIYETGVSDLEPIKELSCLVYFDIRKCNNLTEHQIKSLQETLPGLVVFDGKD